VICTLEQARALTAHSYTVAVSGGFDPIHVGHVRYLLAARALGEELVAIVNGDGFLEQKKGRAFMPLADRMEIINALACVDIVCAWDGFTVDGALEILRPEVFAKGGDRTDETNIPEWETCHRLGIRVATGTGGGKVQSSSDLLAAWAKHD